MWIETVTDGNNLRPARNNISAYLKYESRNALSNHLCMVLMTFLFFYVKSTVGHF